MPKRTAGQPPFEPTDEQRRNVQAMVAYGIPIDEIRLLILSPHSGKPIAKKTVLKHFRKEIDTAKVKANARVGESLFRQAAGAPAEFDPDGNKIRDESKPVPTMTIWWSKCRMGWKETVAYEHSGPDGGPIDTASQVRVYLPDNGRDPPTTGASGKLSQDSG